MPRNNAVDDDDVDEDELEGDDLVKHLRRQLKVKDKDGAALAELRKENAMLKAGVDTSSKLGTLFAKSFEGDLTDIEAIKSEAREIGLLKEAATTDANGTNANGTATGATEGTQNATGDQAGANGTQTGTNDGSTNERDALSSGAMPDTGQGADPRQAALQRAEAGFSKGATYEVAAGSMISDLAQAAAAGDSRVIVANAPRLG